MRSAQRQRAAWMAIPVLLLCGAALGEPRKETANTPTTRPAGPPWRGGRGWGGGGGCCCCPWAGAAADAPAGASARVAAGSAAKAEGGSSGAAAAAATQPAQRGPGWGGGRGWRGGRGGGGGGAGMPDAVRTFHQLLSDHTKIQRTVTDVPGGVLTTTTSADPDVAKVLVLHVEQMKRQIENGQPIRRWDPLFDELFRYGGQIVMQVEQVPGGIKVLETSSDPYVASLIRQHARRGVSEFVEKGWNRVHQPTPLPEGARAAK